MTSRRSTRANAGAEFGAVLCIALVLLLAADGSAQNQGLIVRDNSLGNLRNQTVPSGIDPNSGFANYLITHDLGEIVGDNLFHSFRDFSIGTGEIATYTGPNSIENIISRVTGGNLSEIDGILRSTIPNADVYLINPAGIVFGENASLDVTGAFHASTAENLSFTTGELFEAFEGGSVPTLAVAMPAEFGFLGDASARIAVEHGFLHNPEGVSLHGGSVEVVNSEIETEGGDIVLEASDDITISDSNLHTDALNFSGDIVLEASDDITISDSTLSGSAGALFSGEGEAGSVFLRGDEVVLEESRISSSGPGTPTRQCRTCPRPVPTGPVPIAGLISISGDESIELVNTLLRTDTSSEASNSEGGEILLQAPDILLAGGRATSNVIATISSINGGVISIDAENLHMSAARVTAEGTFVFLGSRANAGSIRIGLEDGQYSMRSVSMTAGSTITTEAERGAALDGEPEGNITIRAHSLELDERSEITASVDSRLGGGIEIAVEDLELKDGSSISARSEDPLSVAGTISITTGNSLILRTGSEITASTAGDAGGNILINSGEPVVLLDESAILAQAEQAEGSGGRINITAPAVFQSRDSVISASAPGGAEFQGSVEISSPEVDLESGLLQLPVEFLDASALLRPSCVAQASAGSEGSFVVSRRRGLPFSPEGLLASFRELGGTEFATTEVEEADEPPAAPSPDQAALEVAQVALARGAHAFRGGQFEEASDRLAEAAELFREIGDPRRRGEALQGLAQTQQSLGRYEESVATLETALRLAEQINDPAMLASVLGGLGNVSVALERPAAAREYLNRAIELARGAGDAKLTAELLNNLGNQQTVQRSYDEAIDAYAQSAELSREAGDRMQEAKALSNAGRAALEAGDFKRSVLLTQAQEAMTQLPASYETMSIRIHLAKSFERLAALSPERRDESLLAAHAQLTAAMQVGNQLDEPRVLSYALGNLGALYQNERRYEEALYLTREALSAAERAGASDSLYRWHWQEGQLLWAQGQAQAAVAAYRRAVAILEETRQETLARYDASPDYFGEALAPVYLELASALLTTAGRLEGTDAFEPLLMEARQTMEQLKAAELRDYFRNECVADLESKERPLEAVADNAAVVYPILLPDRTELLVSGPGGLARYPVAVPGPMVADHARHFRRHLQTPSSQFYRKRAKALYDWLVRPYVEVLAQQGVETLIFVPDGALRTVPMAALHDGKQFLGERFAIAVTPGLSLVDPQPLDRDNATLLLGGMSEAVGDLEPLPKVADEIEAIAALYGGKVLLDEDFRVERIASELSSRPPSVVHLASHAVFTGNPETSFLMTHDGRLTMDRMADLLGHTQFRRVPLELLVLSACETAAGDERAALGLAGVAIRSGARSAIGSLWKIADEAAYELVVAFYTELKNPAVSKAVALQRAQQKLRDSGNFAHPFYWSSYLLISNWL